MKVTSKQCCHVALWLALLSNIHSVEARSLEEIKQSGVINIAIRINNPPMGTGTPDQPAGIDPDLGKMLAAEIKVKPNWTVLQTPKEREEVLLQKKVDLVISSFSVTTERLNKFDFSDSYHTSGLAIMIMKTNQNKIRGYPELNSSDRKITVTEGSTGEKSAKELIPNATFVVVKTVPETYAALKSGQAEALVNDEVFLRQYVLEHPQEGFYILPFTLTPDEYGIGIGPIGDKDNQGLMNFVNRFLAKIEKNGKLEELKKKYIGQPPPPLPPPPPPGGYDVYVVKAGDTLSRIARGFYGDPTKWTLIHDANRATVKYANVIKIGQQLKIPQPKKVPQIPQSKKIPLGPKEPRSSSCEGDIELRLKQLKDLHDKGLIDDELFLQRQKELVQCI